MLVNATASHACNFCNLMQLPFENKEDEHESDDEDSALLSDADAKCDSLEEHARSEIFKNDEMK